MLVPLTKHYALSAAGAAFLGLLAVGVAKADSVEAVADMADSEGKGIGTVTLTKAEDAPGVVVDADLMNLPEGVHALHIHETGKCDPPDFESAGGHFNPTDAKHGVNDPDGMHMGDFANIHVPASGELRDEMFSTALEVDDTLFDDDGAAVVIHAGADDYTTDPAGDAGSPIACGVLKKK